jgi:serine/threonine protein kinase
LGVKCAKKEFSIDTEDSGSTKSFVDREGEFKQEVSMLARLNHPNIVKFLAHGKCMEKSKWKRFIVMELMEKSLHDVIEEFSCRRRQVPFRYCEAIDIMLQVAKAMHYLHMQELAHRDLKPSNVLVSASSLERSDVVGRYMCIKIADFGLSKVVDNSVPSVLSQDKVGTTVYRAPEMASKGSIISFPKADVYSFGIMCSEILSGKLPFDGVPRCDLDRRLMEEDLRPELPTNCAGLTSLINECWAWDATQRPGFLEIFERLKSLNSELLMADLLDQEPSFEDKEPKSSSSTKKKENLQQPIQVMNGGDRQTDIKMLASVHGVINAYPSEDQSLVSRLKNATPPELGKGQWGMNAKEPQNDDVADDGDILTEPWPLNGCPEDMRLSHPSVQAENHSQQLCANHLEQRGASGDATNFTSPQGSSPSFSLIQPGDVLSGLKQQFLELLNLNGGRIALRRIPGEYKKQFYHPLVLSDYHTSKLVDLIRKMGSPLSINCEGHKILHLASVQLSDLLGLKQQFVELLNNRGNMVLSQVPAEYDRHFGRPLYLCDYNASKLINLIKKMPDSLRIEVAAGQPEILCLAK